MASNNTVLLQTLVSAKSAKLQGTKADLVILWFGPNCPADCMVNAADKIGVQIRIVDPPVQDSDVQNRLYASVITKINKWWDFVKLEVFDLTQYKKAVFLDG